MSTGKHPESIADITEAAVLHVAAVGGRVATNIGRVKKKKVVQPY